MNVNLGDFNHLTDFDNVLVVDENGMIIFYDLAEKKIKVHKEG